MDAAENILRDIVRVTQDIQNATTRYSTIKGVKNVQHHSLVRLQLEFRTIVDVSRAILRVFDDPIIRCHYMLSDRFIDWLSGPEPETCLDTLREMVKLLDIILGVQRFSGLAPTRSTCQEDDMNRAIALFHIHKPHFQFLLSSDIWNYEKEVLRQTASSDTQDICVHREIQITSRTDVTLEHQKSKIAQKLKKLLEKLDPVNCSEKHRQTSSTRQSDTCMWLPATEAYQSWKKGEIPFLWLQGKAGAGKSILASSVIDDLNNTKKDGEILVYFYCDFRSRRSTSALEVMRSLLAELTERLCDLAMDSEDLLDELLKVATSIVDPFYNVKKLAPYLSKVARSCPQKPLIVVDGLDECKDVENLLDGLIMNGGDIRMFVTCRPLQNIIKRLDDFPCISLDKMANELSADILLHVTRELDSRHRLRTFDGRLREEVQITLCANADGMFRWVQCQIDTLDGCTSVSEIRRALESLPEGLEETYRRILIRIDKRWEYSRLVRRGLVWLVTSLRPMRLRELLEAVTIDPALRTLDPGFLLIPGVDFLEVSRSLVIHDKGTDIVTLSHMSVKEYLVGELILEKLPEYHIVLEDAHERSARLCMAYISFCLDQMRECRDKVSSITRERDLEISTSDSSRPLLNYVLSYGFAHLAHLGPGNASIFVDMETLQREILRYPRQWDQMCRLVPSIRSGTPWAGSEHDFTMYTLITFASDSLFHNFLGLSCTFTSREGTNPLIYAARFGKTGHAKILVERGANVNERGLVVSESAADEDTYVERSDGGDLDSDISMLDSSDEQKAMPIEVAVEHWHAEILDVLLAEGSTIPDKLLSHVLKVQPRQFPPYVIRRLLQTPEFVKWAAFPWDKQRLLEAFVEDEEECGQREGRDDLVPAIRVLVQVGCAESLLLIALEKGCIAVIMALLSIQPSSPSDIPSVSRADGITNVLAPNGDTPIHIAMRLPDENRCLIITRLLIEAGCSSCERDADDRPPVQVAVRRGFITVVEYFLSLGVTLPARILFAALQVTLVKRVAMIRLLVDNGANVHMVNPSGEGLLHVTMRLPDRSVCLEITKILTSAFCNHLTRNPLGELPLQIAGKQGYHEVVEYLMTFDPSSRTTLLREDRTTQVAVLHSLLGNFQQKEEDRVFAAIGELLDDEDTCLELAKTFIAGGGDLSSRSSRGGTLLHIVVRRGFWKVVECLTSQLASPLAETLLHDIMRTESESHCLHATKIFMEAGCSASGPNANGQLLAEVAINRNFSSVVEHLISRDTPFPSDILLYTLQPLNTPSLLAGKWISISSSLVHKGANVHAQDPKQNTLLHYVMQTGSEDDCIQVTKMLMEAGCGASILPIEVAVKRKLTSVVEYLLSQDAPFPPDILFHVFPMSTILGLDSDRWISIALSFIRRGADVHARDPKQNTLLHHVMRMQSENECLQATKTLMEAGCSAFIRNIDGKLPIKVAATHEFSSVVEYLLAQDAPFPSDILLDLFKAQRLVAPGILLVFIERGADVCAISPSGDSVLHVALASGNRRFNWDFFIPILDVLVQAGCDTHTRDKRGRTPVELAAAKGYYKAVEYLQRISTVPLKPSSPTPSPSVPP